jgi:type VI secretion system protein ImpJ
MPRRLYKVIWSEGMYLAPHHFQAQSRFFEDAIQFTRKCFWKYGYGYTGLEIDASELLEGNFALHHMRGVMPDGTAFEISSRDDLPQRRIEPIFPLVGGSLALMLALPKQREKSRNVNSDSDQAQIKYRFRPAEIEMNDVNTGTDRESIGFLKPNFRIATAAEIGPDDTWLPIAHIVRDGRGKFIADPEFVPPCLQLGVSPLLKGYLSNVLDFLSVTSRTLTARRRASAQRAEVRSDSRALADFWLLHTVNSAIPVLRHWEHGASPHPAEAFRGLAQVAGTLCTFSADGELERLPEYDHMAPAECFAGIVSQIRQLAMPSVSDSCVTLPLQRMLQAGTPSDDSFFAAEVSDPRFFERSRWILAIHAEVPDENLATQTPRLALVSSRKYLNRVVSEGLEGIPLTYLPNPPAACPERFDRKYFSIDTGDQLFELIRRDRSIGLYLPTLILRPEVELHILIGDAPS